MRRLADVGRDELRVIDAFVTRLEQGLVDYGPLDLSKPRDWQREKDEELVDAAVYESCKRVSDRDRKIEAIEIGLEEIVDADVTTIPRVYFGELVDHAYDNSNRDGVDPYRGCAQCGRFRSEHAE